MSRSCNTSWFCRVQLHVQSLHWSNEQCRPKSALGAFGVIANLALLGYFKYVGFFIENLNLLLADQGLGPWPVLTIALPLGVSFFTFQQISYLADAINGRNERHTFIEYLLFVSFFGTVTSGPITNLREILSQLREGSMFKIPPERVAVCVALFSFGLFKKIVLAKSFAPTANAMFDAVAHGAQVSTLDAWIGTVAYFFQLYFDFSGYCDMALALGALFGIKLPLNFNSPLKATSVLEYWKRWHITLTRFITMYLYMPMAVRLARFCQRRKFGPVTRFLVAVAFPSIAAFALAGLWHGAGWNYVVFGLLWGVALSINYAWREARMPEVPAMIGWAFTMIVALISMALFRSNTMTEATAVIAAMAGAAPTNLSVLDWPTLVPLEIAITLFLIVTPNTTELLRHYSITTDTIAARAQTFFRQVAWHPNAIGTAWVSLLITVALLSSGDVNGFLYYKF